ncbi:MAG: baseplate J/gp47 family protein [Desulfovibrionaceae bacterium]|nr:baseplate J/gp47 family protein [Desulfovibrionaceae bacterium]
MPWNRPTLQQLYERISRDFSGRLLDGGRVLSRSVIAVFSKVWAGACHMMHGLLAWIFLQVFADTAEGPYLERWARIWGKFRKEAERAAGPAEFAGQAGSLIPAGALIQRQSTNQTYAVQADAPALDGVISVNIRAVTPGAAANLPPGAAITLIAPREGVTSNGTVMPDGISGGTDEENDEDLRRRLLDRLRRPPRGGSKSDYEAWAREVSGVTRAWCYPMGLGIGTVSLTFVTDNASLETGGPIPTPEMVRRVQEHIEPLRPATVKEWLAFAPEKLFVDVSLSVTPDTEAVRQAVRSALQDLITREGVPGAVIFLSHIRQAISISAGVIDYEIAEPKGNIEVPGGYFPMLRSVDFKTDDPPAGDSDGTPAS